MPRYLSILEVSQKQAYIFSSKEVQNNIVNSAVIAYVLSSEYIEKILKGLGYSNEANMVYSGGGHTILEFSDLESSRKMIAALTEKIYREFDGVEVFAKTIEYVERDSPETNLKNLTKALELKKSKRQSAFKQGNYGIEKIDANSLDIVAEAQDSDAKSEIKNMEYNDAAKRFTPEGYIPVYKFGELGGAKNESNFIAVVHIDGNGMGKRVEELYSIIDTEDWGDTKAKLAEFSKSIDDDFKAAYKDMVDTVADSLKNGDLKKKLNLKENRFPVRRIITAGDDICFVSEGRIGVECARVFIEKLKQKVNAVDKKHYSCCAGVAIVHQKYPFYKAYELAEMLCSNAKKYGAKIHPEDNGSSVSSIDWHIEFGEIKDSFEEIRKIYRAADGCRMDNRPYIVDAPEDILTNEKYVAKKYATFKRIITGIQSNQGEYGTGKIKELRAAIKKGENATKNYIAFYKMKGLFIEHRPSGEITEKDLISLFSGTDKEIEPFISIEGSTTKHSFIFDAIELMDTYISL